MPVTVHTIVRLDQQLVVPLLERNGNLGRFKFFCVINRRNLLAVKINNRPVGKSNPQRRFSLGIADQCRTGITLKKNYIIIP